MEAVPMATLDPIRSVPTLLSFCVPSVKHQIVPGVELGLLLSYICSFVWCILYFLLKLFCFGMTSDTVNAIIASHTSSRFRERLGIKPLWIYFCNINHAADAIASLF